MQLLGKLYTQAIFRMKIDVIVPSWNGRSSSVQQRDELCSYIYHATNTRIDICYQHFNLGRY